VRGVAFGGLDAQKPTGANSVSVLPKFVAQAVSGFGATAVFDPA
jgi:hypothetical protein